MSLAQALSTYLTFNCLILVGFFGLSMRQVILKKLRVQKSAPKELQLHYGILAGIFLLTFFHPFFPRSTIFNPPAKVWSAQSIKNFSQEYSAPDQGGYLMLPTPQGSKSLPADLVSKVLSLIALLVIAFGSYRVFKDIFCLVKIRRSSFQVRKIGSVSILLNDEIQVPFSSWLPGKTDVVLPTPLLLKKKDFSIAIAHELQHHRQQDTQWVYILWIFRILAAGNPFITIWNRWISELQEFACDETLVDQKKVDSQQYARCLVEVAKTATSRKYMPASATGLVFLVDRKLLKRRVEKMLNQNRIPKSRSISAWFGIGLFSLMIGVAYASSGLVQDRRVTLEEAKRMISKAQKDSTFPVTMNNLVLKQLNRYIGTPEGRDFMRKSLRRMEDYREGIETKISNYNLPEELLAVPITESGYQNFFEGETSPTVKSAGLWQFIRSTARNFGLRVDSETDERLNVTKSTDAALRYLSSNNLRFKNWQLALLAYNMGESALQKGIEETGSRDAWVLIRKGYEGDKDNLAKIMAAILIMKNPESVNE